MQVSKHPPPTPSFACFWTGLYRHPVGMKEGERERFRPSCFQNHVVVEE